MFVVDTYMVAQGMWRKMVLCLYRTLTLFPPRT